MEKVPVSGTDLKEVTLRREVNALMGKMCTLRLNVLSSQDEVGEP